ncbi:NAD(P)-binding protein, partial [Mycena polygramma]
KNYEGQTKSKIKILARTIPGDFKTLLSSLSKLPHDLVPCSDMAGEVIAVGRAADVKDWKVGDRVCATFLVDKIHDDAPGVDGLGGNVHGVLTEYRTFPANAIVAIPEHLSYEEASTLPCAAVTAYNALLSGFAPLKAGDTVLVQGTGGVSIFALQFAVASGATVIAISSSDEKLKTAIPPLGAKHVVNYRTNPDWATEVLKFNHGVGVDHVIEVAGNATLAKSIAAVKVGGSINIIGGVGGAVDGPPPDIIFPFIFKQIKMGGGLYWLGDPVRLLLHYFGRCSSILHSRVKNMNKLISANAEATRPVIDKVFSFDQAKEAYAHLQSQAHVGKVVIKI